MTESHLQPPDTPELYVQRYEVHQLDVFGWTVDEWVMGNDVHNAYEEWERAFLRAIRDPHEDTTAVEQVIVYRDAQGNERAEVIEIRDMKS